MGAWIGCGVCVCLCLCVSVCVPMMYTFTRSAAQQRFESRWYENMRLCCMSNGGYCVVSLSRVG
jgi:hypothetical protein